MFSPLLFLQGFNIFNGEKLAKLIFYAILIAVGIGIYHRAFVMPTTKNVQRTVIEKVEHLTLAQDGKAVNNRFLGVKVWHLKAGVSWE